METDSLYSRPSRAFERAVGLPAALLGIFLLAFSGFIALRAFGRPINAAVVVILAISTALGVLLFSAGARLITSTHRSDGGLFSPWVLRLGDLIFIFAPIVFVLSKQYTHLLESVFCFSAGVACFALANRRQERSFSRAE